MSDGDHLSCHQQSTGKGDAGTHSVSNLILLWPSTWVSDTHYLTSSGEGRPGHTTLGHPSQRRPSASSTGQKSQATWIFAKNSELSWNEHWPKVSHGSVFCTRKFPNLSGTPLTVYIDVLQVMTPLSDRTDFTGLTPYYTHRFLSVTGLVQTVFLVSSNSPWHIFIMWHSVCHYCIILKAKLCNPETFNHYFIFTLHVWLL